MNERDKEIMSLMGECEMLSQLAEECCELGQAALKLRRVLDGRNPTPKTEEDARENLLEEIADVYNAIGFLVDSEDCLVVHKIIQRKKDRWLNRLHENMMKQIADETKESIYNS